MSSMTNERIGATAKEGRNVDETAGSYISSIGSEQSGYIMFMVLFVLVVVGLVGIALIVVGTSEVNVASRSKMMEEAYAVAEAGINRAATYVSSDRSIASAKAGQHGVNAPGSPETWQWGCTEKMPGDTHGEYVASVYYDTDNPTETTDPGSGDGFYKLVRSRGKYTWSGKSVERTIEAKMYIPASYQESYDEAFDYCIYNGFNKLNDESGNWPSSEDSNDFVTFDTGKFIFDAAPITVGQAHGPLGAIYTRGNIQLSFDSSEGRAGRKDRLLIKGNVVATNNLTIKSAATHKTDIDFGNETALSNLVAGIDGTGNATVTTGEGLDSHVTVFGAVCAGQNVIVGGDEKSFFQLKGGLIAGGNVLINRSDVSKQLTVGDIVSHGSTVVNDINSGTTIINSITAGFDPLTTSLPLDMGAATSLQSSRLGVGLVSGANTIRVTGVSPYNATGEQYSIISSGEIAGISLNEELWLGDSQAGRGIKAGYGHNVAYNIPGYYKTADPSLNYGVWLWLGGQPCAKMGDIVANGRVNIEGYGSKEYRFPSGITAGTDGGVSPVGVYWRVDGTTGNGGNEGDILSYGGIVADARNKTNIEMQGLWSGADINLTTMSGSGYITAGTIKAGGNGNVTINANDNIQTATIQSNGAVSLKSAKQLSVAGAILARGDVSLECARGNIVDSAVSGIWGQKVGVKRNYGAGTGTTIGAIPGYGTDSIRATGQVTLDAYPGKTINVGVVKTAIPPLLTPGSGTVNWTGKPTQPGVWSPAVLPDSISAPPGTPAVPPVPDVGHGTNPNDGQPYEVDMLGKANLSEPVRFPEPNWWHFMQMAIMDDNVSSTPAHMISDGGPGDADGVKNGVIDFLWQAGEGGYSSNETVYQNNPNVEVMVKVKEWGTGRFESVSFKGTLVSMGPVTIDAADARWDRKRSGENILNVISGSDVTFTDVGALNNVKSAHFHLYASKDIIFSRGAGKVQGGSVFYGSFTAGNKVVFDTERLFEKCTFSWSRWDIDPTAWVPMFKTLSWREI